MTVRRPAHPEWRWLVAALAAIDALMVGGAFLLAYVARFDLHWFKLHEQQASPAVYLMIGAVTLPVWLTAFAAAGLYRSELLLGGPQEYARLAHGCTYGFAAIAVLSFLGASLYPAVSRGWLVACWPMAFLLTAAGRFAVRRVAYRLRSRGLFITNTVIVGVNAQSVAIAREIDRPTTSGVRVLGFLDDYIARDAVIEGRWTVLGPPSALAEVGAEEAILVQRALAWESLYEIMRGVASGAEGPHLRVAPTLFDLLTTGISVRQRANVPLIALNESRIAGFDALLKGAFEYALSAALLAVLAPALLARAAFCAATGRRAFVRQAYRGANGRTVDLVTLPQTAPETARLRRLFEKGPALIGVLRGQVALVGPRLTPAGEDCGSDARLALHSVKPGLTGPVSVAGVTLPEETALALEVSYIRSYSIWRDIHIVWQRILLVLRRPAGRRLAAVFDDLHTAMATSEK